MFAFKNTVERDRFISFKRVVLVEKGTQKVNIIAFTAFLSFIIP